MMHVIRGFKPLSVSLFLLNLLYPLILMAQAPVANFSASLTKVCGSAYIKFTDLSTNTPNSWTWDFGGGATTITGVKSPVVLFSTAGVFTIKLTVSNASGTNTKSVSNYITINALPTPAFTASNTTGCVPLKGVSFTDLSTGGGGAKITKWVWTFGDGSQASTLNNPIHDYTSAGSYPVGLTVTDANGCVSKPISKSGFILINPKPNTAFSATSAFNCTAPFAANFSTADAGVGAVYNWNFGDGQKGTGKTPVNTYTSTGNYTVSLLIATGAGCKDSLTKNNYIGISTLVADFKSDLKRRCVQLPIQFTDLSSPTPTSYSWDFGDGNTSTQKNPSHAYTKAGNYSVTFNAKDASGCIKTITKSGYIIDANPSVGFTSPSISECKVPATISFTDTTSNVASRLWTFGNGSSSTTANPMVSNIYNNAGNFNVSLKVTNTNGCTDSNTKTVVKIVFPVANFVVDKFNGCTPLGVTFTDKSSSVETITNWSWDFDDKSPVLSGLNANPLHSYIDTGVFYPSLTITNNKGCVSTFKTTKSISPGIPPNTAFSGTPLIGCFPLTSAFTDASDKFAETWTWNFGDGTSSSVKNPSHKFGDVGYFDISLKTSFHNCFSAPTTKAKYIFVQSPRALFSSSTRTSCVAPFAVAFKDSSKGAKTWAWDFGDPTSGVNNISTLQNPATHTFQKTGFYTIKLIVTDPGTGCSDTIKAAKYVQISDRKPGFVTGAQVGCQPFNVAFTDTSKTNTKIINWKWDFGDGSIISGLNKVPNHTYTLANTYAVKLFITDSLNCLDSIVKPPFLIVKQVPKAQFSTDKTTGCTPLLVNFTDASTGPKAPIISWQWKFGDGQSITLPTSASPPAHTYATRNSYPVTLVVTDNQTCKDTITKNIVATYPAGNFTIDSVACNNKAVTILNTSSGPNSTLSYLWDFGDGTAKSTQTQPNHVYSLNASKNLVVKLTVTDNNGCIDSTQKKNVVFSRPFANFIPSTSYSQCPPSQVNFKDSSYSISTSKDFIKSRKWFFGDPSSAPLDTSTTLNPGHLYQNPQTYYPKLIVSNLYGCVDTSKAKPNVVDGPVFGALTYSPLSSLCSPMEVTFTITGKNIAQTIWNYGDGFSDTISTGTVKHSYTVASSYTPQYYITDSLNGKIKGSKKCTLGPFSVPNPISLQGPLIGFDNDSSFYCGPVDISYSANGDIGLADSLRWDFGDGKTSTDINPPQHHYDTPKSYTVSLTAFVQTCKYVKIKKNNVNIFKPSAIQFTQSDTGGCIPKSIKFKTVPSSINLPLYSWKWSFGNGDSLLISDSSQVYTKFDTSYTYKTPGVFNPSAVVVFKKGRCTYTYNQNKNVYTLGKPPVNFEFSPLIQDNAINTFNFNNKSVGTTNFLWNFGDGTTSSLENPVHSYVADGVFSVTLLAKNPLGCADTLSRKVKSTGGLVIGNAFTPNGDGINDKFAIDLPGAVISKFSLEVYDRWGKLVYESADYKNDWDGKDLNNKMLPFETYYYILKYNNRYSWNGYITILKSE
jgi:gliding motility-associated-like protein